MREPSICACNEHAFVKCTRGVTALFDTADIAAVREWNWCADSKGYVLRRLSKAHGGKAVYLHHLFVQFDRPGHQVDHINRNRSDNRRSNLRVGTNAQNQMNRKAIARSGLKGVTAHGKRWKCTISKRINGERVHKHLGVFDTKEEAARAYDQAAVMLFGPWARGNFLEAVQ